MITQMFNPTADFAIPAGTQTNETDAEIETEPLTLQTKRSKFSTKFKYLRVLSYFSLIFTYSPIVLFHLKDHFSSHQIFII